MHLAAEVKSLGKDGVWNYFSEEQKFLRAVEHKVQNQLSTVASLTEKLRVTRNSLKVATEALHVHGLETYAKGLEIQGEHAAANEIRDTLIKTADEVTAEKFAAAENQAASKGGKKPGGGGGGSATGGGAGGSPPPTAGGGEGSKAAGLETKAAEHELEKGGETALAHAAEAGFAKTAGKYVSKAIPFVGIGVGAYFVKKDLENKEYGRAGVDAAEAIPAVGDAVLVGDVSVQAGTWAIRKWSSFLAEWQVSYDSQLRELEGKKSYY